MRGLSKSQKPLLSSPSRCSARIRFRPCTFSLFINDLQASLSFSVSCFFYSDYLAIWSSFFSVLTAMEATQEALFQLERWSEYWCLPLNTSKCDASFSSVDPHQANLQPNFLLLNSCFRFNLTPTFLGSLSTALFPFSKHVSSLKTKFFSHLKSLCCVSASSWDPFKKSLSFLYKAFLRRLFTYGSPGWFPFLSVTISPNWSASTKRLVAPSPAASSPPLSHFFSPRLLCFDYELPRLISLFHPTSGLFVSQSSFPFQVWPD